MPAAFDAEAEQRAFREARPEVFEALRRSMGEASSSSCSAAPVPDCIREVRVLRGRIEGRLQSWSQQYLGVEPVLVSRQLFVVVKRQRC